MGVDGRRVEVGPGVRWIEFRGRQVGLVGRPANRAGD